MVLQGWTILWSANDRMAFTQERLSAVDCDATDPIKWWVTSVIYHYRMWLVSIKIQNTPKGIWIFFFCILQTIETSISLKNLHPEYILRQKVLISNSCVCYRRVLKATENIDVTCGETKNGFKEMSYKTYTEREGSKGKRRCWQSTRVQVLCPVLLQRYRFPFQPGLT